MTSTSGLGHGEDGAEWFGSVEIGLFCKGYVLFRPSISATLCAHPRLGEYPFPEREVMLRTKGESPDEGPKEPSGLYHAVGEPDDVVQTVPTLDQMRTLRSNELLYLMDERQQAEVERLRKEWSLSETRREHYAAFMAVMNATSERDGVLKKLNDILGIKSARVNAINSLLSVPDSEQRPGSIAMCQQHRDAISHLEREKVEIVARLADLNDKVPLLREEELKQFRTLNAVKLQAEENRKAMAKGEDKSAIICGLESLLGEGVIADDGLDDILCFWQAIRGEEEAMEMDDEPAGLEGGEDGAQARG
ncbi:hypothetical protein FMUND_13511 [Fusarium mundagurra]|uniref:Uncharacterized protein n=1 Tax=Fusarium mundagurra TaxID=1567541 RepID=A0A8H6D4D6_9HYPO|nr:hypothetical protein FMUND_13511 [Fusarium mundagurra]